MNKSNEAPRLETLESHYHPWPAGAINWITIFHWKSELWKKGAWKELQSQRNVTPARTSLKHGRSRREHPTSQSLLLISWPVQSGSHKARAPVWCNLRSQSARVQARVEKSRAWVNGFERRYSWLLLLLSTEYAPGLCILRVNILVELSPLYIKNAHDFELVQQTRKCSQNDFLGNGYSTCTGFPWKIRAGCKVQRLWEDGAKIIVLIY